MTMLIAVYRGVRIYREDGSDIVTAWYFTRGQGMTLEGNNVAAIRREIDNVLARSRRGGGYYVATH